MLQIGKFGSYLSPLVLSAILEVSTHLPTQGIESFTTNCNNCWEYMMFITVSWSKSVRVCENILNLMFYIPVQPVFGGWTDYIKSKIKFTDLHFCFVYAFCWPHPLHPRERTLTSFQQFYKKYTALKSLCHFFKLMWYLNCYNIFWM